jgi:hypothetical protein
LSDFFAMAVTVNVQAAGLCHGQRAPASCCARQQGSNVTTRANPAIPPKHNVG